MAAPLPLPALHATHAGIWLAGHGGEVREATRGEAIARVAETPHIILNAPLVGQRLGYPELSGLDLLELFAFVHPARFAVPTVAGMARALAVDIPADEQAALTLQRIAERLLKRMNEGLVQEAEDLLRNGLSHERMASLGLEYRFLSELLKGEITEQQFTAGLQTAIQQYAKRQLTWFRKMEKQGIKIHWFRHDLPPHAIVNEVQRLLEGSE